MLLKRDELLLCRAVLAMKKIPTILLANYFQVNGRAMLLLQRPKCSVEEVAFTEKLFILTKNWLAGRQTCPAATGKLLVLKDCF